MWGPVGLRRWLTLEHAVPYCHGWQTFVSHESYRSLTGALTHAGIHTRSKVNLPIIRFRKHTKSKGTAVLADFDAISGLPGGFGKRGPEADCRDSFARENPSALLGHCVWVAVWAVVEFAAPCGQSRRQISTEVIETPTPWGTEITEWKDRRA